MLITYNHARYIARALDSILEQKVDFPFAIHVIDDCSTDGAQDIIRDYAARHPGVVKPFINKKNIGRKVTQKNFYRGLRTLDGEYMAVLEGDDCWTSPDRLRAHVEFLDANPDFVACAHNVLKVYEGDAKPPELYLKGPVKEVHDIEDLIGLSSFFHASSLTFRNVFRGRAPRYFRSPLSCDIFMNIAHAQFGKIRYTPDLWSLYQVHGGGLFSSMSQTKGWMWNIEGFLAFNRWLGFRYLPQFAQTIYRYCDTLLVSGREEDGLTSEKRRRYEALRRRYRRIERACRWADVLAAKWIPGRRARGAPVKLNLGCGRRKWRDCVNIDIRPEVDPDMVVDLERTPWPWPDGYAQEVRLIHALEHLGADLAQFDRIMGELYRICQPGGRVHIRAAHPRHDSFMDNPACVRPVTAGVLRRFDAVATAEPVTHAAKPKPSKVDFEIVNRQAVVAEPYLSRLQNGQLSRQQVDELMKQNFNVCADVLIELVAHKPPRPARAAQAAAPAVTAPPAAVARG